MLTRIRVLGLAVLVAGICAVVVLAQVGGAAARNLPAQAGFVPRAALPSSLASTRTAASVTAGMNWVDGMINENSTFLYGNYITGYLVGYDAAYVGYYADTDAGSIAIPNGAYPQAGDVYYMHVVLTLIGNPGSGGDAPIIDIQLPANTQLAIDSSHPTYCYFSNSPNPLTCSAPTAGTWLPISLGQAPLASYITFEEQFPVKTTAPLNGLCTQTPLYGTSIPGTVSPACVLNYNQWALGDWDSSKTEFDYQGIYVPALTLNTTIGSKPASSTTSTSASFSFSSNASGASFDCSLGSGAWAGCTSPKSYSGLAVGSHQFRARAKQPISYAGISQTRVDPTPASFSWTITSSSGGGSGNGSGSGSGGGSGGGSHPAAKISGSGKISAAHLSKKTFKRSEAAKVKLLYSFSHKSKHFAFLLSLKKGGKWLTVRSVKKTGSFKGSYTMTVKKLFGKKPIKAGRYHLKLTADKNSKLISFRIT